MHSRFKRDLDPLDLELLERAFEGAWVAVKENDSLVDLDTDEALEAILRLELIEIARFNGVSDAESLRDVLWQRCWISVPRLQVGFAPNNRACFYGAKLRRLEPSERPCLFCLCQLLTLPIRLHINGFALRSG
jgi:hypothetical protein